MNLKMSSFDHSILANNNCGTETFTLRAPRQQKTKTRPKCIQVGRDWWSISKPSVKRYISCVCSNYRHEENITARWLTQHQRLIQHTNPPNWLWLPQALEYLRIYIQERAYVGEQGDRALNELVTKATKCGCFWWDRGTANWYRHSVYEHSSKMNIGFGVEKQICLQMTWFYREN
jgi:hypothetical protein